MPCKWGLALERGTGEVCSNSNLKYLRKAHPEDYSHFEGDYFRCGPPCKGYVTPSVYNWMKRTGFD